MIFWGEVLRKEARGSEQYHAVPSPWLVVSHKTIHRMPIAICVPLSTKLDKGLSADFRTFRIRIPESEISRYVLPPGERDMQASDSLALTEQVRVMAHNRLKGRPIANVNMAALAAVEAGLKFVMDLA
jgi:mRNA-degrading endonuclease toxin of MazEF toxin-antitoxin module